LIVFYFQMFEYEWCEQNFVVFTKLFLPCKDMIQCTTLVAIDYNMTWYLSDATTVPNKLSSLPSFVSIQPVKLHSFLDYYLQNYAGLNLCLIANGHDPRVSRLLQTKICNKHTTIPFMMLLKVKIWLRVSKTWIKILIRHDRIQVKKEIYRK